MCELDWEILLGRRYQHLVRAVCMELLFLRITPSRMAFQNMVFITSIMKLMKFNVPFNSIVKFICRPLSAPYVIKEIIFSLDAFF